MFSKVVTLSAFAAASVSGASDIGDSVWRTFDHERAVPIDVTTAKKEGWSQMTSSCNSNLGVLYAQESSGPSEDHPLAAWYTSAGQLAGVQVTVFGKDRSMGNAAPDNLVNLGYWKASNTTEQAWTIDMSFRAPSDMCSGVKSSLVLGDRAVINQDSIKFALPLTADEAVTKKFDAGSCIAGMGQHFMYDVKTAPDTSFVEENLMPVVPMFNPATEKLSGFFFTTPVKQSGSRSLSASNDWDIPAVNGKLMCYNWCDEACAWETSAWSTMHVFVSSGHASVTCPGGETVTCDGL